MSKSQSQMTLALLFGALALLTFFGVTFATGMIDFLYRDAPGLTTFRSIAQDAALLGAVGFFAAGFIVAVRAALQPGKWFQKVVYVLPLYLLLFTLAGVVSGLIGVGTVGNMVNLQGVGGVTFATAWVAIGAVLTTIALVIAAARVHLDGSALRSATLATGAASAVSVIAVIVLLLSVAIVSTNKPASFGPPGGGQRPGGQGAQNGGGQGGQNGAAQPPSGQGAQNGGQGAQNGTGKSSAENGVATTPEVSSAPPPAVTAEVGAANPQSGAPESTREPGGFQGGRPGEGQGGFPGGDRGGPAGGPGGSTNTVSLYTIGAVLMTIFVIIEVGSAVVALRSLGGAGSAAIPASNLGSPLGSVVLTFVGITIVGFAVIQLVPVSRDNPPVQSTVKWDSPQTQALVERACMNCHSNETTWPWYASIAPSSWLTSIHVHAARQQLNLSELNNGQGFRRSRVFEEMVQQIQAGNMPPKDYQILHPEARLSDAEKQQLIQGLQNTQSVPQ
ncbi:MAG: heme-binding domain-containing protein [Chloroflexota bacterium]